MSVAEAYEAFVDVGGLAAVGMNDGALDARLHDLLDAAAVTEDAAMREAAARVRSRLEDLRGWTVQYGEKFQATASEPLTLGAHSRFRTITTEIAAGLYGLMILVVEYSKRSSESSDACTTEPTA